MCRTPVSTILGAAMMAACAAIVMAQTAPDRTTLPIPEPPYPHSTVFDVRNATPPPRFEVKAPAGAPNVLIVLWPERPPPLILDGTWKPSALKRVQKRVSRDE